ncbi:MAG: hypothetical protein AB1483_10615 [Candidatus Zixiibacteriota bacterium]
MFFNRFPFISEREQRLKDDIWIASRGGVWPKPWGFYAVALVYGLFWALSRTELGMPSILAPIFKSAFIRTPIIVIESLLILGFTGLIGGYMLSLYEYRGPYWMVYYGKGRLKKLHFMVGAISGMIVVELFFDIFYLIEWMVGKLL